MHTKEAINVGGAVIGNDVPLAQWPQIWDAVASHCSEDTAKRIKAELSQGRSVLRME